MRCDSCKWNYPFEFLSSFQSNKKNIANCCGICALQFSNELHNEKRTQFDGEVAEEMRQAALNWRRKHPHEKPY